MKMYNHINTTTTSTRKVASPNPQTKRQQQHEQQHHELIRTTLTLDTDTGTTSNSPERRKRLQEIERLNHLQTMSGQIEPFYPMKTTIVVEECEDAVLRSFHISYCGIRSNNTTVEDKERKTT